MRLAVFFDCRKKGFGDGNVEHAVFAVFKNFAFKEAHVLVKSVRARYRKFLNRSVPGREKPKILKAPRGGGNFAFRIADDADFQLSEGFAVPQFGRKETAGARERKRFRENGLRRERVGATLFVRCIKGVRRAAMAPVMPVKNGMLMIADSGANIECKPEMLEQFAVMGSVYMKNVLGIENPRVGLANNGAEETKGTDLYVETHKVLKANKKINFVGNVEGRGVPMGECDVLVCDGFTGNLILKTYEGAGKMFADEIKNMFKKSIISKIGALFVMDGIKDLKKRMDYKEIGGAVILGISKPVIKAHGSSDEKAFFSAIRQAVNFVSTDVISKITDEMAKEAE